MSIWQEYSIEERQVMLQQTAIKEQLPQPAIEKDWWVTVVLKALFMTDAAPALLFKGGTSLSKGWHLIERLSEDVDLALDRSFFDINGTNKSQRDKLNLTAGRNIEFPNIYSSLRNNGSPMTVFETGDTNRFFRVIFPIHRAFVRDGDQTID